jgi:phosphate starvation-inducible protein PhoH
MTALDGGAPVRTETKKAMVNNDKRAAALFRQFAENGQAEKALDVASLVLRPATMEVLLKMAATLGLRKLEEKIETLLDDFQQPTEEAQPQKVLAVEREYEQQQRTPLVDVESSPYQSRENDSSMAAKQHPIQSASLLVNPFAVQKPSKRPNLTTNSSSPSAKMPRKDN